MVIVLGSGAGGRGVVCGVEVTHGIRLTGKRMRGVSVCCVSLSAAVPWPCGEFMMHATLLRTAALASFVSLVCEAVTAVRSCPWGLQPHQPVVVCLAGRRIHGIGPVPGGMATHVQPCSCACSLFEASHCAVQVRGPC